MFEGEADCRGEIAILRISVQDQGSDGYPASCGACPPPRGRAAWQRIAGRVAQLEGVVEPRDSQLDYPVWIGAQNASQDPAAFRLA